MPVADIMYYYEQGMRTDTNLCFKSGFCFLQSTASKTQETIRNLTCNQLKFLETQSYRKREAGGNINLKKKIVFECLVIDTC